MDRVLVLLAICFICIVTSVGCTSKEKSGGCCGCKCCITCTCCGNEGDPKLKCNEGCKCTESPAQCCCDK